MLRRHRWEPTTHLGRRRPAVGPTAPERGSAQRQKLRIYRECVTAFDTLFSIEQSRIPEPALLPPACNRLLNSGCVHGPPPLSRGESLPNATALLTSYQ